MSLVPTSIGRALGAILFIRYVLGVILLVRQKYGQRAGEVDSYGLYLSNRLQEGVHANYHPVSQCILPSCVHPRTFHLS